MTRHSELTAIHIPYNWSYADATAREAATGFVAGDVGKLARQLDDNSLWMLIDDSPETWVAVGGSGGAPDYILVRDQKTSGTNGGTFTSGAWQTRDITTEVSDVGNHCSVGSNQITLVAGTYECRIVVPGFNCNGHAAKLYNVTDAADELIGSAAYAGQTATFQNTTLSIISGKFTIAGTKVFEIRHQCQTTSATYGFGVANSFGVVEVFTIAEFWKVG